jgi:competence ComEA-like helix-hairpin-helix protein
MRPAFFSIPRNGAILFLALLFPLSACVTREYRIQSTTNDRQTFASTPIDRATLQPESTVRVNINTAPAADLEKLPGIGRALAARIVEHREKYGPFRRPEHLIIVRGISERRFRALQNLITVE